MKLKEHLSFLVDWSKHIVLPGFSGMNLYDVACFFIEGLEKGAITTRASSIAFNFFLALFPALIFFYSNPLHTCRQLSRNTIRSFRRSIATKYQRICIYHYN